MHLGPIDTTLRASMDPAKTLDDVGIPQRTGTFLSGSSPACAHFDRCPANKHARNNRPSSIAIHPTTQSPSINGTAAYRPAQSTARLVPRGCELCTPL
eukprot:GDKH01003605.1.p3 GENE.GDKH01003605.1~~GDKH01003605.1.p3  ORF type:complete len:98 (+),score=6.24 GDKH01003605.1:110-403(+)